jgi:hypothetical protein
LDLGVKSGINSGIKSGIKSIANTFFTFPVRKYFDALEQHNREKSACCQQKFGIFILWFDKFPNKKHR